MRDPLEGAVLVESDPLADAMPVSIGPSKVTAESLKRELGPFNPLAYLKHPEVASTAIRTVPAIGGAMVGGAVAGPVGAAAGGAAGSSLGYLLDQWRTGRKVSLPVLGLEAGLGAIPGGKTGATVLRNVGKRAVQGAGLGTAGGTARIGLEEGRLPTSQEFLTMGGTGAVLGGALGGLESRLRRPAPPPPVSRPLLALPPAHPLPVTPEGRAVMPRIINQAPETEPLISGMTPQEISAAQKRLNAPVKARKKDTSGITVTAEPVRQLAPAEVSTAAEGRLPVPPGPEVTNRMALLRREVDDARTNLPTGKQYGTTEGETGVIQKHAIGAGKSIREQLAPLYPELNDLPNVGPKDIITAIDKDRGNKLYLQIQDAVSAQLEREKVAPAAATQRPSDFEEFSRFVDDLAAKPEQVAVANDATYNGVQEGFGKVSSSHVITLNDTQDTISVPLGASAEDIAAAIAAKRAIAASTRPKPTQPRLLDTQATMPPAPLQAKAPQVEHGDLLAGFKKAEPEPPRLPLGEEPKGTVEFGMGVQIPKSIRDATRRFFTGEEKPGAKAHSGMNYRHLLNRVLGTDPQTGKGIGDLVDAGYRSTLREAGRHDLALGQAKLHTLNDAEQLNLIHVFKGQARPLNEQVKRAFEVLNPVRNRDADLMEQGGMLVRRDAVYDTKTGARIRDPQYKPFQRLRNHYHEVLDPRLIVKYSPDQLSDIIRKAPYAENRAIDAATANDMATALLARAKGEIVPSSVGDNAKRILRLGQPTASHLHERNRFWRIPDEILMRPKDAWPLYSEAATRELGWLEALGPGYQKIEQAIMRARQSGRPDAEMAVQAWDRLRGATVQNPLDATIHKWIQLGKSTATGTLITPFTGIKQLSQGFRLLGSDIRWRSSLGTFRHAVSRLGQDEAKRLGAMVDTVRSDMELLNPLHERFMPSDTGLAKAVKVGSRVASAVVKTSGTIKMDGLMRSWGAHAAKQDFLAYQREAAAGSRKAVAMLKRFDLTPQSSVKAVDEAAQAMSLKINYRADPLAIPGMFFHNTMASLASTLNKFNIGVVSDLRQNFIIPMGKAVTQKNWKEMGYQAKRIAKYLALMGVGGEVISDTILTLRGRAEDRPGGTLPEFLNDLSAGRIQVIDPVVLKRFAENVVNAGTFGALSLVSNIMSSPGGAAEKGGRITGAIGGAAIGTAAEAGGHVANLLTADRTPGVRSKTSEYDRAKQAAARSVARRVPLVGASLQDVLRTTGAIPGSKTSEQNRAAAAIARARARGDRQEAVKWQRWFRQRHHQSVSLAAIKQATQ